MIRWITERLGTSACDQIDGSLDIRLVDVRDLVDKGGNIPVVVKSKIDEALAHLKHGDKVVVCCDYGISRSNAIAAGILAIYENISLNQAIDRVRVATLETGIKIEVLSAVRQALSARAQSASSLKSSSHRLLLTGASGFVGSALMPKLDPKYKVVAPTRQDINLVQDAIALDLLVKEQNIDTIIHLANPRIYTGNEAMGATLLMLKNILDVCKENRLFLIYISSWEIYSGYQTQELRANETLVPRPGGVYGQTKLLCEVLIEHYHSHYRLPRLILRPSPVYGPGSNRSRFIWNFLNKALNDQEIITHKYINGFPKLDMLHIDDLLTAIVLAIGHREQGEINLGTGIGTSTTKMAKYIVDFVGSPSKIRHIKIEEYTSNIIIDNRQALVRLGWHPTIDLVQGLHSIVRYGTEKDMGKTKGVITSKNTPPMMKI